jgi:predicted NBD/HSP70 family sugar kinase
MSEITTAVKEVLAHAGGTGVAYKDYSRRKRIIAHLSQQGAATLTELSELINISIPKATDLIAGMEQEGLVLSKGRRSEGPGRKASVYSLSTDAFYFLGLEIKKYSVNIGLMGFDKQLLFSEENISFLSEDAAIALEEIVSIIRRFIQQCGIPTARLAGIGCSISGRVNMHTGDILTIYHFGNAPVKAFLEKSLGIPVYLDNDSRALSYGEFHFGKRTTEKEVLVLNLDYGIAIGIFIDGKPVYGASGYAGELGHIPLFDNEKICFCGKKGCLETEASGRALVETLEREMQAGSNSLLRPVWQQKGRLELQDVVNAIQRGDNLALEAISNMAAKLGRGLAVTINLFNPQLIVLSGILSAVGDALLLPVKEHILRHSLHLVNTDTQVVLSDLAHKAGILGCCLLVRDKIFGLV